jgi:hypothetical protein
MDPLLSHRILTLQTLHESFQKPSVSKNLTLQHENSAVYLYHMGEMWAINWQNLGQKIQYNI